MPHKRTASSNAFNPFQSIGIQHNTSLNNNNDTNNNKNTVLLPTINYLLTLLTQTQSYFSIIDTLNTDTLQHNNIQIDSDSKNLIEQYHTVEQQYSNNTNDSALQTQYLNLTDKVLKHLSNNQSLCDTLSQHCTTTDDSAIEYKTQYSEYIDIYSKQVLLSSELYKTYIDNVTKFKSMYHNEFTKYNTLTQQLDTQKQDTSKIIHSYDIQIQSLMSQIDELQRSIETQKSDFNHKITTETQFSKQQFEQQERQLQYEYEQLQQQLQQLNVEHAAVEHDILQEQNNKKSTISDTIAQYDRDINFYHSNITELTDIHNNEKNELHELTGYFVRVDAETERLTQEHKDIVQRRDAELLQLRQLEAAKGIISNLYSDYYVKNKPKPVKAGTPDKDKKGKKVVRKIR